MVIVEKDIHLQYTEELTKKSVLYFCWSVTGRLFVLAIILSIIGLISLIEYEGSQLVISLITFTLIWVPTLLGLIYYVSHKRALQKFRNLPDGKAIFGIAPDHFSLKVGEASSNVPWTSIRRIHPYQDFWIILLRTGGYFTLPTYNLLPEDKAFIFSKVGNKKGRT